jgi:hypothetical protein
VSEIADGECLAPKGANGGGRLEKVERPALIEAQSIARLVEGQVPTGHQGGDWECSSQTAQGTMAHENEEEPKTIFQLLKSSIHVAIRLSSSRSIRRCFHREEIRNIDDLERTLCL